MTSKLERLERHTLFINDPGSIEPHLFPYTWLKYRLNPSAESHAREKIVKHSRSGVEGAEDDIKYV